MEGCGQKNGCDPESVLQDYQLWPHGYVAAATLRASRRALAALAQPRTLQALTAGTDANDGHLAVALRTLAALGWVTRREPETYAAPASTIAAANCSALAELCEAVYQDGPGLVARLTGMLQVADDGWPGFPPDDEAPPKLRTMLTGAVLAPLLMELHTRHVETSPEGGVRLRGLTQPVLGQLGASFRRRGMCEAGLSDGSLQLTATGGFVVQRCGAFGVALSYRPMLRQLETVLFDDVSTVFTHDAEGHEAHVDRTMNVVGSGFMHGKFFDDMMRVHVHRTFDELPLEQQPSLVADTGCGDGTLLCRLYEYVRDKTRRGRQLDKRPLLMVGVDFNDESLVATSRTLAAAEVPFETMFGDIGDPEAIHVGLCSRFGARGKDDILHVRSFLDHDRPFIEPADTSIIAGATEADSDAAYVRASGARLARALVYRNLVEHMRRWAAVAGRHGLLLLEVRRLRSACEGPSPDASRARSLALTPRACAGALAQGGRHGQVHGGSDLASL